MMVLMHKPNNQCVETSKCWEKNCKQMKTPKTPKPSELALAGEEQACIFDSTPAMTSPESASEEPSDTVTVIKPCTLQTISVAPSWSLHALDGHMATRQPWKIKHHTIYNTMVSSIFFTTAFIGDGYECVAGSTTSQISNHPIGTNKYRDII